MRDFSAKQVQEMSFTINGGKTVYKMPLASSMPLGLLRKITRAAGIKDEEKRAEASIDAQLEILTEYLGAKVAERLEPDLIGEIFSAWAEESDASGADLGE